LILLSAAALLGGCQAGMYADNGTGAGFPDHWSKRVHVEGADRTYRVHPHLYRGARPTAQGRLNLRDQLGIRTIISLRAFHDDSRAVRGLGMSYVRIPLSAWEGRIDDEMIRFLQVVKDPAHGPFYVHCKRGGDRAGVAIAIYRICIDGWSNDEAVNEMLSADFGFLPFWKNLADYVRRADAAKLCREAGLPPPPGRS